MHHNLHWKKEREDLGMCTYFTSSKVSYTYILIHMYIHISTYNIHIFVYVLYITYYTYYIYTYMNTMYNTWIHIYMWVGLRAGVEDIGVVCVNPLLPVDPASSVGKLNTIHTCAVWLLCRKIGKHYFSHSGAPSTPPSLFLLMGVTFTLTPWNLIIAEFKNRTSSTMFVRQATFSKDRSVGDESGLGSPLQFLVALYSVGTTHQSLFCRAGVKTAVDISDSKYLFLLTQLWVWL